MFTAKAICSDRHEARPEILRIAIIMEQANYNLKIIA